MTRFLTSSLKSLRNSSSKVASRNSSNMHMSNREKKLRLQENEQLLQSYRMVVITGLFNQV